MYDISRLRVKYTRCGGSPRSFVLVFYERRVLALDRFFVKRGEGKETCSFALREGM
jgi:hypothetical protein